MSASYVFLANIWPSIIATLFMLVLAVYSFRHRYEPGALPFYIACVLGLLWALGSLCEYAAVDISLKIFWRKFQVIFQLPAATAITCFLLEYAWPKRWLTRRNLLLLSIVPTLMLLLILTNNVHHLFWEGFKLNGGLVSIDGPLMKYFIAYIFVNFLMNMSVFVWLFIHSPENRWPVTIIVIGQIMMRIFYFIDIADQVEFNFQYAAVGIALTSLMYAIVFYRFRILGPIPLARQAIIEQLPIGMIVLDDQQKICNLNPAAEEMLKITTKSVKGLNISKVLPDYPQSDFEEGRVDTVEFTQDFGGKHQHYRLSISNLEDWRGLKFGQMLLVENVTEQKEAQARIIEQARVLATMGEREQIARELHDDLAQAFAFIDTQGQTIQRLIHRGELETADKYLVSLIGATRDGEVNIREAIRGMRMTLSKHGLLATLEDYLVQFKANTLIQVETIKSDDCNINLVNPMVEVQLLRILQEALTNIRKHANASKVQIKFDRIDSSICVAVHDNGLGFKVDQDDFESPNHYGLRMMQERAVSIGGTINLSSQLGQGTEIIVCVPLDHKGNVE